MDYKSEYKRWLENVDDKDLYNELISLEDDQQEDAFFRELSFGTGGLRGIIGAGTNRMNIYVVAKASQGLANYLRLYFSNPSVVIGYDSRIKSDVFARIAASVFAANNIVVHLWPQISPVPTVSYAIRHLKASQGVMITASHNPSKYNGYKVYGSDGCQITTKAATRIFSEICKIDYFNGIKAIDFNEALMCGKIRYIEDSVLNSYIENVKKQSVLFDDMIDKDVSIVYSPLNGTGLIPVTRVLSESGFSNITIVEEQKNPDGDFPTCPFPNPEIRDAMKLGLEYCKKTGADLLLATDPDADRCGIAVKTRSEDYQLLSGNEVGLLLLDYVCSQRKKHATMPDKPIFIKTIVTTDLAEKIANSYGVRTINVLTGFKFIGEQIGWLEKDNRENDYIFGFEESYGYLTGSYVRDKDAVNAAFMICEMFAYYKTRGISLLDKLNELYNTYGFCLNTQHSYDFYGSSGMEKMQVIMENYRKNITTVEGMKIIKSEDYLQGINGLPKSDVLKIYFVCNEKKGNKELGSVVIRPSGTEPKLKIYISIMAENRSVAESLEKKVSELLKNRMKNEY